MTYAYLRFSTSKQDEVQQIFALEEYAKKEGLKIDDLIKDEGVSGGVSYKERNLYKLVRKLRPRDILITTEISRLGRAMSDISKLLNDELKPKKVRLIIIKMGIDVDCANMKAQDDFLFSALSFAAQVEKEMIQQRTQAAMDARKKQIELDGGFMSKKGNYITHFGSRIGEPQPEAVKAMARKRMEKAVEWKSTSPLFAWLTIQVLNKRSEEDILRDAADKFEEDPERFGTRRGQPLGKTTYRRYKSEILKKV